MSIRIGVIDSGVQNYQAPQIQAALAFQLQDQAVITRIAQADQLQHGSRIVDIIAHHAPQAQFHIAQVFQQRFTTSALQVAAAIDWLIKQEVQLINLSLGLRHDRSVLQQACQRAVTAGILVCASTPARGEPVYPAAYEGVWRMTGDGRCRHEQWSYLNTIYADYGAYVKSLDHQVAGASMGCAHLSGHIAQFLQKNQGASPHDIEQYLKQQATFKDLSQKPEFVT